MTSPHVESPALSRAFRVLSLCFAVFVGMPTASLAASGSELVKVRAEGESQGVGTVARNLAVETATREAVLLWVQSWIGEVDASELSPILDLANHYAQSSRVVDVSYSDSHTRVVVDVYLHSRALRADVAALLLPTLPVPPGAVLLISEQGPGDATRRFDSSARAVELLREALNLAGIEVVNPDEVRERYTLRELLTYLQGGDESIAKFGRENRAEVVIAGTVSAQVQVENEVAGILRARAVVDLSLVGADDAQLYDRIVTEAELSCRDALAGARMAIEDATVKAREDVLVGAALAAVRRDDSAPHFELSLSNPRDWRDVELVAERLREAVTVGEVEVLRSRPGAGLIRFEYSGKVSALVEHLAAPLGGGRRIEAERVVGNELVFGFTAP